MNSRPWQHSLLNRLRLPSKFQHGPGHPPNDIARRVWEHKADVIDGFTKKYGVHILVYYEVYATMPDAIRREKQMKRWNRACKIDLIQKTNPQWRDIYEGLA